MSEEQKARCRAAGAVANLIDEMGERLEREGRSARYIEEFWRSLKHEMGAMAKEAD